MRQRVLANLGRLSMKAVRKEEEIPEQDQSESLPAAGPPTQMMVVKYHLKLRSQALKLRSQHLKLRDQRKRSTWLRIQRRPTLEYFLGIVRTWPRPELFLGVSLKRSRLEHFLDPTLE